jgi:SNF2 family DNA or RNA helicase
MVHQGEALTFLDGRRWAAIFAEQGTGKSWMILADAERCFHAGKIDALLIIAPKGVHTNFVRREIPTHLSPPFRAWAYNSGKSVKPLEDLLRDGAKSLKILAINIDALAHKAGYDVAMKFMKGRKVMLVVDESQRIKTPTAVVTKRVLQLASTSTARRIMSGTPLTNSPPDLFSQFEFLKPGFWGQTHRAFVARYAHIAPDHSGIMRHIAARAAKNPAIKAAQQKGTWKGPQIVEKDFNGRPKWRNLEELRDRVAPHTFRVLKKDCLDLPEKVFERRYFDLVPGQRMAYNQIKEEHYLEVGDDLLEATSLTAQVKLQQVTSGFVLMKQPDETTLAQYLIDGNPRLELLEEVIDDIPNDKPFIIFAHFREEIRAICALLEKMNISHVQYHGGVSQTNREKAIDEFQSGAKRGFVGQPGSGGIGITLTAADIMIYASMSYNWGNLAQSQDRIHRIGQQGDKCTYIMLCAVDTVDEDIAFALEHKGQTAATVLGDN